MTEKTPDLSHVDWATAMDATPLFEPALDGHRVRWEWQQQRVSRVIRQWLCHRGHGWNTAIQLDQVRDGRSVWSATIADRPWIFVLGAEGETIHIQLMKWIRRTYPDCYHFVVGHSVSNSLRAQYDEDLFEAGELHTYRDVGFSLFDHPYVPHYHIVPEPLPAWIQVEFAHLPGMLLGDPVARALHVPVGTVVRSTTKSHATSPTPMIEYRRIVPGTPFKIKN
jgi:DNA-directed RNA polymerase subunit H (RpoH/RPB5)